MRRGSLVAVMLKLAAANSPNAFVLGDMDLVAPLGRAGIDCVAIARPGDPSRRSRYVRRSIDVLNAWHEPQPMAARLVAEADEEIGKPVLFFQTDPDLLMVSRFRDQLGSAFRFVVADPKLVEELVDKSGFHDLAQRNDLPVPATAVLGPGSSLSAVAGLSFPVIVKPALRHPENWVPIAGKAKAISVGSRAEFESLWGRFEAIGAKVIVQELLEGPESAIESYHVYVDAKHEIAGEFTGRKIRTRPEAYGVSTSVEVLHIPSVRKLGREIIERIGLTGVAKLDFKRDRDGNLRLLEINARFSLWHHPGALAGVNLPALVYADLTGTARPAVRPVETPTRWVKPWYDVLAAREQGLPPLAWARFAARCSAKSAVAWRDPMAAVAAVRFGLKRH